MIILLLNTTRICIYIIFKSSDPTTLCLGWIFPLNVADWDVITSTCAAHSVQSVNEILTKGKLQFFTLLIVTWQFNCEHDLFNLHGTFHLLFKHSACRAFIRQDEHHTVSMKFLSFLAGFSVCKYYGLAEFGSVLSKAVHVGFG